jgi:hypothetical protein
MLSPQTTAFFYLSSLHIGIRQGLSELEFGDLEAVASPRGSTQLGGKIPILSLFRFLFTDISVFCCTLSYFLVAPVLVSSFETGRLSQVLTTAVVLVMACPHEIYVLQVLSGRGVAALNAK